jgi:GrpB-like predicted nucleotidyltransferase (UPF0157 family)
MLLAVIPYQSTWPKQFFAVARDIRSVVHDSALRIDHIGSTAVLGLCAKPVIDVQLTVHSLESQQLLSRQLQPIGLHFRPQNSEDRPPVWDSQNPVEWQKLYYRTEDDVAPRVQVHVREAGRRNQRYALLFRDFLRANSTAREAYALFKERLSLLVGHQSSAGGTGPYLDMKDPVLDLIAEAAERWAATTSWSPAPSDA